jgi:2-C-methyl-D-erythritol 4-phosphate cytidylyltransferase
MTPRVDATSAIVLAAGAGARLGAATPKALVEVAGRPLVALAAAAAAACPAVAELVVAAPEALRGMISDALANAEKPVRIVEGGPTRQASVRAALDAVGEGARFIVVHDAARPLATAALFSAVIDAIGVAAASGAGGNGAGEVVGAIPVVPIVDTLKRVAGSEVVETIPRDDVRAAQTPQAFVADALRSAHERAARAGVDLTDDAAVIEWAGGRVVTVEGDVRNLKITAPEDVLRAIALASQASSTSHLDG